MSSSHGYFSDAGGPIDSGGISDALAAVGDDCGAGGEGSGDAGGGEEIVGDCDAELPAPVAAAAAA